MHTWATDKRGCCQKIFTDQQTNNGSNLAAPLPPFRLSKSYFMLR
jgi:hypothetical protein